MRPSMFVAVGFGLWTLWLSWDAFATTAWLWIKRPSFKFLCSSTNDIVTLRDARRHKQLVQSLWYQRTFRPDWEIGEIVRVQTGPFADFTGKIEDMDLDQSKVTVLVDIFGRDTPVDLGFGDIQKA